MLRLLEMMAVVALVVSCLLMVPAHRGTVFFVLFAVAAASLAVIVAAAVFRRRASRTVPKPLSRLAYRSDENSVAFAWRWRSRRGGRLRILRSREGSGTDADEHAALIYDGTGEEALDAGVEARRAYHYALLVETPDGAWTQPLRLRVLTLSSAERRFIEASHESHAHRVGGAATAGRLPTLRAPDPLRDPKGLEWSRGGSAIVGNALGSLATDAVFAAAHVFADRRPPDEWEEVT